MSPYLTAKTSHRCVYANCPEPCSATSVECETHRKATVERQRLSRQRRFVTPAADLDYRGDV